MRYLAAALLLLFSPCLLAQFSISSLYYGAYGGFTNVDTKFKLNDGAGSQSVDKGGINAGMLVRYRPYLGRISYQMQVGKNFVEAKGSESRVTGGLTQTTEVKAKQELAVDLLALYHPNKNFYIGGGLAVAAFTSRRITTQATPLLIVRTSVKQSQNHFGVKLVAGFDTQIGVFGQLEYAHFLKQEYDTLNSDVTPSSYGIKLGYLF